MAAALKPENIIHKNFGDFKLECVFKSVIVEYWANLAGELEIHNSPEVDQFHSPRINYWMSMLIFLKVF